MDVGFNYLTFYVAVLHLGLHSAKAYVNEKLF